MRRPRSGRLPFLGWVLGLRYQQSSAQARAVGSVGNLLFGFPRFPMERVKRGSRRGAPDLAIEIVSEYQTASGLNRKVK